MHTRDCIESARDVLRRVAREEVLGAASQGGLALRMMFEARSSKEVAEVLARHMPANSAGLSSFVSARQACGELHSDIAADVLDALFELFWTGAAGQGGES